MLAALLPHLDSLDWTDETILKAVKDLVCGHITEQEFDRLVTGHEREYKLKALAEKEGDE